MNPARSLFHERRARAAAWIVPVVLLLYGLGSFPLALFGPDRNRIPGDLVDPRFNNYILEHFHQYATGKVDRYWDAPFMVPKKNVIALSENLLGTAPIYSLFRQLGYNRETAFQWWILAMFTLNYVCCFIALRLWSKNTVLAACGAYLFAFGIHFIGQLEHAEVYPRSMVPLVLYFFWHWLDTRRARSFIITVLLEVYQFYCGIGMGFMVLYALLFLFISHLVVHRDRWFPLRAPDRRRSLIAGAALVVGTLLLLPLVTHYLKVAGAMRTRPFSDVLTTLPRPVSYFFTHPAALSWRDLSLRSQFLFPEQGNHFQFVGALPWASVLVLPFLLWSRRIDVANKRLLAWLGLSLFLSIVFCLNVGGFTLYRLLFVLPGSSALRAIDGIINVQVVLFAALFVMVFRSIPLKGPIAALMGLCLPLLAVLDNRVDVRELKYYDKYASRERIHELERRITQQYDSTFKAIAYMPAIYVTDTATAHDRAIEMNMTAMLAAQHLGTPVVNGYSGSYPDRSLDFADRMDRQTLAAWCAANNYDLQRVQPITNVGEEILATKAVHLKAPNGLFVQIDGASGERAHGNAGVVLPPQKFLRIDLKGGRAAFLTHTGKFLCAELLQDQQISATAKELGDFGIFQLEELAGDTIALRSNNGRYVSLDTASFQLFAKAGAVGPLERFELTPAR